MYFLYHKGKRFLNLQGNLILTHNARLVRGNNRKATPQSIAGGLFVNILPDSGFWLRWRATWAALSFIWGVNKALDPDTDIQYREWLKSQGVKADEVKEEETATSAPIPIDRAAHAESDEADPC